jgi:hypothetical protein
MGNRASVIFYDAFSVSPTVYLHWDGQAVPAWLEQVKHLMDGRFGDASYAAARFTGICHAQIEGNLSLGICSNNFTVAEVQDPSFIADESPGDAGIVIVNTNNFDWSAYGGYLADAGRS